MNLQLKIIAVAILGLLLFLYVQDKNEGKNSVDQKQQTNISTEHQPKSSNTDSISTSLIDTENFSPESQNDTKNETNTPLPAGVSERFHDKPKIQVAWINKGKDTLIKNIPDIDSTNFRKTYFNRAFTGRPTTCGEVQLIKENKVVSDYQRFIYVGVETTYLESNIQNFDIFWDKMCIQTFEN